MTKSLVGQKFTGVLLWISSLFSGWVDNWFAYHQMSKALSQNKKIRYLVGEKKARFLSQFIKRNLAAISGSISLGFLLGMTPVFLQFLGLQLDVRHVTLSAGSVAAEGASFSQKTFQL